MKILNLANHLISIVVMLRSHYHDSHRDCNRCPNRRVIVVANTSIIDRFYDQLRLINLTSGDRTIPLYITIQKIFIHSGSK